MKLGVGGNVEETAGCRKADPKFVFPRIVLGVSGWVNP